MKLRLDLKQGSRKRLACAIAVALMLSGCSQKTSEEHLASAQAFIQASDLQAAVVELKNAIQLDPQAPTPRFELGKLYLEMGDYSGAEKELSRSMELGQPAAQVVPLLSRAYQRTGSVNAMAEVDHQLKDLTTAERVQVGFYKLQSLVELEQQQEARLLIEELLALDTSSVYQGLVKGVELVLDEQPQQAFEIVKQMRDTAPLNQDALLMFARLHLQLGNLDEAIEAFKDYISKHSDDNNTKFLLAAMLVENQRPTEAETYVADLLALSPDNPMLNQLKGIILSEKGEFEKAYEHLTKAIESGRNDPVLRLVAGYSAFQLGDYEAANMHLAVIASQLPDDHPGLRLLAASQLQLGLSGDAQSSLQRLRTESSEDAGLYSRAGYELLREGNVADARAMLERTEQLGEGADDLLRLGVLQLSLNQVEGLINLEEAAAQAPESTTAQSTLATAYLATGDLDKAAKLADDWKKAAPDSVEPYLLAAEVASRRQNAAAAQAEFEQALALQPESATVLLAQANFLMQQEQVNAAAENVNAVLALQPDNLSALAMLYMVQSGQGDVTDVIARAEALLEQTSSNEVLRVLLARMHANEQNPQLALELLSRITPNRQTPRDFWSLKGRTLLQANQFNEAERHYQQWVELFPYDKDAALGKLLLLDLNGDAKGALEVIERFLEKRNDTQIRLLQAHFYSMTGDVVKSREVLASFPDSASQNPFILATQARNYLTEGNFADAIEPAAVAYEANKNLRNLLTLLGSLEGAEQNDEAYSLLQKHAEEFPSDTRARMLLAERKIQRDSSAAIKEYAALVAANDQNFIALNNLAYLTLQAGDVETAFTYAERAVELQPTNAAASDTLAQVYRAQSKLDEALELYERTVDDNMNNEEIYLNYVEVLLEAGNTTVAQRRLEQRTLSLPESIERLEALKAKFGI